MITGSNDLSQRVIVLFQAQFERLQEFLDYAAVCPEERSYFVDEVNEPVELLRSCIVRKLSSHIFDTIIENTDHE